MMNTRPRLLTASMLLLAGLALSPLLPRPSAKREIPEPSHTSVAPGLFPTTPTGTTDSPSIVEFSSVRVAARAAPTPAVPSAPPLQANPGSALDKKLTSAEQKSLWQAVSEARREVREIPAAWAGRKENLGYDFYAQHPKQNLTARFGAGEIQIVSSERANTAADAGRTNTAWEARMWLQAFAGNDVEADVAPEKRTGSRVEYRRAADLTEWYDNGPEAMEHGFTITRRPANVAPADEVVLELRLDGLAAAERDATGQALVFRDGEREVLTYEKLLVLDANGKALPARMAATAGGFQLSFHDVGATYPVTMDPLIVNSEAKFNRFDASPGDEFGVSVSVSGDTVVVGAHGDDDGGGNSGSAYVFKRIDISWILQAKLTAPDAAADDQFGGSVSISGDTVVVGAKGDDDGGGDSGSAHVFTRSGGAWSPQAKLTAPEAAAGDAFGVSVSISGHTVVVGAWLDDDGGNDSGSAHVFTRSGSAWTRQAKLTGSDTAAGDQFGHSVSASGDTVVVGAHFDNDGGAHSGSAYVFTRSGSAWSQQAKLTASDAAADDQFGYSVSASGDTVVAGAPSDDNGAGAPDSGSAYVFARLGGTWSQQAKLSSAPFVVRAGDQFGFSVSVSGDTVMVGAPFTDYSSPDSGSAHVFTRSGNTWSRQDELSVFVAALGHQFGTAVAVSGATAVVGAPRDGFGGTDTGSADVFTRSGSDWGLQARLVASDAEESDDFGWSVSVSGDTVVVGAPRDDDGGVDSGSAYVFTRSGAIWRQQAKLTALDAAAIDAFGYAVAVSGDTLVVGAYLDDDGGDGTGSAYVFTRSRATWSQQAKLTAADAAAGDLFGYRVSVSADTVVVGALLDDDGGSASGSAYVFTRSGGRWRPQAKLLASDAAEADEFGGAVSVYLDTVVVGARRDDDSGIDSGSAYVFTRGGDTWIQQVKLTAADPAAGDHFGWAVSISGDTVLVGALADDDAGLDSGSAYVFTRDGGSWSQQAKLTASDAAEGDGFGRSVSISGDTAVVGSSGDDDGGSSSGSAHVFTRNGGGWDEQAKLTALDAASGDLFGFSVSVSGNTVVAGAEGDDDGESDSGSVYVHRVSTPGVRRLQVMDPWGNPMGNGGAPFPLEVQPVGTAKSYVLTLTNVGELGLDLQAISLGGTDAGQFSLGLPDLSTAPDLAQSQSLPLAVTFQPVGASGARTATLLITSDDPDSPFSIPLAGLGLSKSEDGDHDGMNDWAEHALRGFGFDWLAPQTNLVADYYALAPEAGLLTLDQVAGLKANASLLEVDLATSRAKFAITVRQGDDLSTPFTPIIADPARLSVDAQGRIVYEVNAPGERRYYLMDVGP